MPRYFMKAQDPVSCYTHFLGAVLSLLVAIAFLITGFVFKSTLSEIITSIIFVLSAVGLYSASCIYHYFPLTSKYHTVLRKLDHSMIYVLIAGSYTPFCVLYLNQNTGLIFTLIMWAVAIGGIILKICWLHAPRALYTSLYLIMGWAIIFFIPELGKNINFSSLILLGLGGISYSLGGIIYIVKKPNFTPMFGFHELFHCFILAGTLFHFVAVAVAIF